VVLSALIPFPIFAAVVSHAVRVGEAILVDTGERGVKRRVGGILCVVWWPQRTSTIHNRPVSAFALPIRCAGRTGRRHWLKVSRTLFSIVSTERIVPLGVLNLVNRSAGDRRWRRVVGVDGDWLGWIGLIESTSRVQLHPIQDERIVLGRFSDLGS